MQVGFFPVAVCGDELVCGDAVQYPAEVSCLLRAECDAVGAGDTFIFVGFARIIRVDGVCRTETGTGSAPVASSAGAGNQRYGFGNLVGVVAFDGDVRQAFSRFDLFQQFPAFGSETVDLLPVACVGAVCRQCRKNGVLGDERGSRNGFESVLFDELFQFEQGIVVVAVSICTEQDGRCRLAFDVPDGICREGGYATGIYRHSDDQQFVVPHVYFVCQGGLRDVGFPKRYGREMSGDLPGDFAGAAGGTETDGTDACYFHVVSICIVPPDRVWYRGSPGRHR